MTNLLNYEQKIYKVLILVCFSNNFILKHCNRYEILVTILSWKSIEFLVALVYNEEVKQKNYLFIIWQHIIGICVLVLTVLFSWLFLAEKTSDRMQDQMEQARNIALSHSSMATIDTESFFHGKEAYLSFIGKDQEGQELAVLVAEADDQVYAYPLKEGISQKKAKSIVKEKSKDAIDRVTFGRFKGKPIWEVKAGSSYYVVDFKTGKVTSVF